MGKRSIKENKNIYFTSREEAGFTRAEASELLEYIPAGRIEKIENEKQNAQPADVLAMARVYQKPELCNYYCTHECPIGKESMQETKDSPLPEIILGMIASLNSLEKQKDRLIEITADGRISDSELPDFVHIQKELDRISGTVDSLKLWVKKNLPADT